MTCNCTLGNRIVHTLPLPFFQFLSRVEAVTNYRLTDRSTRALNEVTSQ